MNFIELKVEDFIDEVLDSENEDNTNQIKLLKKFAAFIGRETEVYSVGDLTEEVILDYLRTLRNPPERRMAVDALTGFFAFHFVPAVAPFPEDLWGRPICGVVCRLPATL